MDKHTQQMVELARAKCGACGEMIESESPGHFVTCSCGKSFVDTDRFEPRRHRYGGEAIWNKNLDPEDQK